MVSALIANYHTDLLRLPGGGVLLLVFDAVQQRLDLECAFAQSSEDNTTATNVYGAIDVAAVVLFGATCIQDKDIAATVAHSLSQPF